MLIFYFFIACLTHLLFFPIYACENQPGVESYGFRPNIVWITCEDMSPRLGCFGDPLARTPVLDQLASDGIRYTHVFSVSGVCAPSRSALITGMYPTSTGAMHMRTMSRTASIDQITDPELLAIPTYEAVPLPAVRCFPEYLRIAGYYCTNNAKEDYQFRAPPTVWDESSNQAHWKNRESGQPFFAVFNITVTHESQVWQRAGAPPVTDPRAVIVPPYYPDTPLIRKDIARHYDNIALMDSMAGEILRELEDEGLMDSTIIFFFSDHGDGFPRAKRWIYDSGIRVPLIIRYPDRYQAGEVSDELVSFIDFAPSVLSLAGIDLPVHLQGHAFAGKQASAQREYVFAARDRMDPAMDNQRGVRDKRFKYIRNYMPDRPYVQFLPYRDQMVLMQELFRCEKEGLLDPVQQLWFSKTKPVEELYDTWNDPHEVNNLAEETCYRKILRKMRKEHERWKKETHDWGTIPETELVRKLWPPDGVQPVTSHPEITSPPGSGQGRFTIEIISRTDGASIGYRISGMDTWKVYDGPFEIGAADTLQAVAQRIGYRPSTIVEWVKD